MNRAAKYTVALSTTIAARVFDIPLLFSSEYDRHLYLLGTFVSDRSLRFSRIGAT